jgi:hypothetical protein
MISCPKCALEKSKRAYRLYQHDPLRKFSQGKGLLTVRIVAGGQRHILMIGCHESFCGLPLGLAGRRELVGAHQLEKDREMYCASCAIAIYDILGDALEAEGIAAE